MTIKTRLKKWLFPEKRAYIEQKDAVKEVEIKPPCMAFMYELIDALNEKRVGIIAEKDNDIEFRASSGNCLGNMHPDPDFGRYKIFLGIRHYPYYGEKHTECNVYSLIDTPPVPWVSTLTERTLVDKALEESSRGQRRPMTRERRYIYPSLGWSRWDSYLGAGHEMNRDERPFSASEVADMLYNTAKIYVRLVEENRVQIEKDQTELKEVIKRFGELTGEETYSIERALNIHFR